MNKEYLITLRNLAVIPLIVGLVLLVLQFGIQTISEKELELSYSLEDSKILLDKSTMGNANVEINGANISSLYSQSIRIWNSGDIPINALPIKYFFNTSSPTFQIFGVTHDTNPKYEFGKISLIEEDQYSKRYVYDLLNSNDEFTITILTNEKVHQSVYAKAEGLSIKQVIPSKEDRQFPEIIESVIISSFTIILVFIQLKLIAYSRRQSILDFLNYISKK